MGLARLLVIVGSGETGPTMTASYRELLAAFDPNAPGVVLDTPAGFQLNARQVAARAVRYFRQSLGHTFEVASLPSLENATPRQ